MRGGLCLLLAAAALGASYGLAGGAAAGSNRVIGAAPPEELVQARAKALSPRQRPARPAPAGQRDRGMTSVNALEAGVLARVNVVRARCGLRPLRLSARLAAAAQHHSTEMGRRGFFRHESADGTPFWRRIERFYPRGFRSWSVGENLLWGSETYGAAWAVRSWMQSPPQERTCSRASGARSVSAPST